MPRETIAKILMRRDGMSEEDAEALVEEAREELMSRLENGDSMDDCYNICQEYFGLEPDYLDEIIPI